ncbi:MAG: TonB-dependent receptor plug domain-containing protein [Planctomycetaceae bacterium]|nr:TonB-dependent receptor plug domain-containing protein [Planctomycetaceae bacterium]
MNILFSSVWKNFRSRLLPAVLGTFVILCSQELLCAQNPAAPPIGSSVNTEDDLDDDDSLTDDDILDLDIEQLGRLDVVVKSFDVEVSTVTRKESTVGKSPAAVFVITQEMIRQNGARTIPEILRMAPGIHVAQVNASKWAISSRGVSGFISNKTLVLLDGRKLETPIFDGTIFGTLNWDAQDIVIEDIERIEVVRGPGGTLWGANAVNGVINIITKNAKETQGDMISTGTGGEDKAITSIRHGNKIGDNFHYRIYGKQSERDRFENQHITESSHGVPWPKEGQDDWRQQRVGFRADWDAFGAGEDFVTFQGDYYQGNSGFGMQMTEWFIPQHDFNVYDDYHFAGGNFLTRWKHVFDEDTTTTLQAYYDGQSRSSSALDTVMHIFDVEWTNTCSWNDDNHITWGARFRTYNDDLTFQNGQFGAKTTKQTRNLGSIFIQDEIDVIEDVFTVWLGTKVEHNDYTGFENQPSARFLWTLNEREIIWGAASRAVRTPSRNEDDMIHRIGIHDHTTNLLLNFTGNRNLQAENVVAFELGYRSQPTDGFSWDVAGFYNDFSDLIAYAGPVNVFEAPNTLYITETPGNNTSGASYGAEISSTVQMTDWWEMYGSFSYVQIVLDPDDDVDTQFLWEEGATPHAMVFLQNNFDVTDEVELGIGTRFIDSLPSFSTTQSGYIEMAARLGYRPNEEWEFALIGTNLLNPSHVESHQEVIYASRPERSLFGQVIWRH